MDPRLTVENVAASYPGRPRAIRDISFSVRPGEAVAVIGPSGAGKTTLFRTLARLQAPADGQITLDGADLYGPHARRQLRGAIGYVHQQHAIAKAIPVSMAVLTGVMHSWSSVKILTSGLLGPTRAEIEAASEVLARVGLAGRENCRVGELSVGQRQRVAVARTLLQQPKLIVADEPVASLDAENADQILALLAGRTADGAAVLCAVHDVAKARRHFERFIGLRDGEMVFDVCGSALDAETLAYLADEEAA